MKTKLKAIFLGAALALAVQAVAGEDSTHRWGAGGTGPAWYQTECGLVGFRGPVPYPDAQRPCSSAKYSAIPRVDSSVSGRNEMDRVIARQPGRESRTESQRSMPY